MLSLTQNDVTIFQKHLQNEKYKINLLSVSVHLNGDEGTQNHFDILLDALWKQQQQAPEIYWRTFYWKGMATLAI